MAEASFRSIPGMTADADLSADQYRAVRMTGAFQVGLITNANAQRPIGILQDDPDASGKPALVAYDGVCRARVGTGGVTAGDGLSIENDGDLITDAEVTDGSAVDLHHIADALETGAVGDVVFVLLHTPIRIGKE